VTPQTLGKERKKKQKRKKGRDRWECIDLEDIKGRRLTLCKEEKETAKKKKKCALRACDPRCLYYLSLSLPIYFYPPHRTSIKMIGGSRRLTCQVLTGLDFLLLKISGKTTPSTAFITSII
jgi:hypothetical protein